MDEWSTNLDKEGRGSKFFNESDVNMAATSTKIPFGRKKQVKKRFKAKLTSFAKLTEQCFYNLCFVKIWVLTHFR